jgi:sigma-E factor negative regulatory protein RseC
MQNPYGQIISIDSSAADYKVVVAVDAAVNCERCASGKGCGAGLFAKKSGKQQVEASVASDLGVKPGDFVSIVMQPTNILRAAIIVYGYPLIAALLAASVAYGLGLNDIAAAAAALLGLASGISIARVRLKSAKCLREFTPTVVERLRGIPG